MEIDLPINVKIELTPEFEQQYKNAIDKAMNHIHKTIKNNYPGTKTKNALKYEIDYNTGEARIGWDKGSKEEMIGSVLESGSGQRGRDGGQYVLSGQKAGPYQSKFGDSKPNYKVPIVPKYAKTMHFKGQKGDVFMKEFKGHIAKYKFSDGIVKSMRFLPQIIEQEFNK